MEEFKRSLTLRKSVRKLRDRLSRSSLNLSSSEAAEKYEQHKNEEVVVVVYNSNFVKVSFKNVLSGLFAILNHLAFGHKKGSFVAIYDDQICTRKTLNIRPKLIASAQHLTNIQ